MEENRMHKKLVLFLPLLVAFWLASCSHSPAPSSKVAQQPAPQVSPQGLSTQGTPTAVVTETEFDFGLVSEGNDYVHDFKIANQGDAVLEIIKVLPA
jgi:hypothetical protein